MKKLLVIVTAIILFGLSLAIGAGWTSNVLTRAGGGERATQTIIVQVRSGDTLWSIAESIAEPADDIRELVWEIRELNDTDPVIQPGQELEVPK